MPLLAAGLAFAASLRGSGILTRRPQPQQDALYVRMYLHTLSPHSQVLAYVHAQHAREDHVRTIGLLSLEANGLACADSI